VHEDRPAPDWLGGVSAGVDAWTRRASGPAPAPPPDRAVEVPEADAEAVARKILLDQLTGQARSRQQLSDKLAAKNVPTDVATRLLDRFEEVGLVDDEAFARSWVASRGAGGGRALARRALAQELRRKGVDDEVARLALDEIDPDDEREAARALVRKKLRSLSRVDDVTATRRLVGMLARKGYGSGLSFAVVREELATAGVTTRPTPSTRTEPALAQSPPWPTTSARS
jgi:regulatory protein